jgi:hypothetical protein
MNLINLEDNSQVLVALQEKFQFILKHFRDIFQKSLTTVSSISSEQFYQQLVLLLAIGMMLKEQIYPLLFVSSSSSASSSTDLIQIIPFYYQLDLNLIRKSLSFEMKKLYTKNSTDSYWEMKCCRFPLKLFSFYLGLSEKTENIENILRKLAFVLLKYGKSVIYFILILYVTYF